MEGEGSGRGSGGDSCREGTAATTEPLHSFSHHSLYEMLLGRPAWRTQPGHISKPRPPAVPTSHGRRSANTELFFMRK